MTPMRPTLLSLLSATVVVLSPFGGSVLAQGSDRLPGGVERSPDIMMERSVPRAITPMPAPVTPAAPAASAPASSSSAAGPANPAVKPTEPAPADAGKADPDKKGKKKSKKSSKGSSSDGAKSYRYESAPPSAPSGGGSDRIPGGVERSPTAPGQP